ncbi:MAG: hypothetical protein R3C15_01520 [Thermoleophilia bacterium]
MDAAADEWRVEVDLDDDEHGFSLTERLRSLTLGEEARDRLGRSIVVTRSGSRLFLYGRTPAHARAAEAVVRELLDDHELTGDVRTTRWHPIEQEWKDASLPLPTTPEEQAAEIQARTAAEVEELEREGTYDWTVRIECDGHAAAVELAATLAEEGHPIARHWRWVGVGALTQEEADALAATLRERLDARYDVSVEVNTADLRSAIFRIVETAFQ